MLVPGSIHAYAHRQREARLRAIAGTILRSARRLPGGRTYTIAHSDWSRGFFHWITEAVPRMIRARAADPDCVLLLPHFPKISDVQRETVAAMNFPVIEPLPAGGTFIVDRLRFVTVPPRKGEFDPADLAAIRDHLRTRFGVSTPARRRIYVTRRDAFARKVANEDALVALLSRRGFETVSAETLPFAEQVRLFGSAEALVSIHGAGLTNMLWMPSGGAVLEFAKRRFPHDFAPVRRSNLLNPSYARMAPLVGHRYAAIICDPVDPQATARVADLVVDIDATRQALDRLAL
nr:glycosyltransferase family 61 protein [Sphingomonas gilva]